MGHHNTQRAPDDPVRVQELAAKLWDARPRLRAAWTARLKERGGGADKAKARSAFLSFAVIGDRLGVDWGRCPATGVNLLADPAPAKPVRKGPTTAAKAAARLSAAAKPKAKPAARSTAKAGTAKLRAPEAPRPQRLEGFIRLTGPAQVRLDTQKTGGDR